MYKYPESTNLAALNLVPLSITTYLSITTWARLRASPSTIMQLSRPLVAKITLKTPRQLVGLMLLTTATTF